MKKLALLCLLAVSALTLHAQAPELAGNWQGTLELPNGKSLRTVIVIAKDDNLYKSTFYNIDQGGSYKAASTRLTGSTVTVDLSAIGISYEGKLSADGNSIAGTFIAGRRQAFPCCSSAPPPTTAWEIPAPPPPAKRMAADSRPRLRRRHHQAQQLRRPLSCRASTSTAATSPPAPPRSKTSSPSPTASTRNRSSAPPTG